LFLFRVRCRFVFSIDRDATVEADSSLSLSDSLAAS
jgi:hypothetical protein